MIHLTNSGKKLNPAFMKALEQTYSCKHKVFIVKVLGEYQIAKKKAIIFYHIPKDNIIGYIN